MSRAPLSRLLRRLLPLLVAVHVVALVLAAGLDLTAHAARLTQEGRISVLRPLAADAGAGAASLAIGLPRAPDPSCRGTQCLGGPRGGGGQGSSQPPSRERREAPPFVAYFLRIFSGVRVFREGDAR